MASTIAVEFSAFPLPSFSSEGILFCVFVYSSYLLYLASFERLSCCDENVPEMLLIQTIRGFATSFALCLARQGVLNFLIIYLHVLYTQLFVDAFFVESLSSFRCSVQRDDPLCGILLKFAGFFIKMRDSFKICGILGRKTGKSWLP